MVKQTRGLLKGMRWLMPATAMLMFGCPNEELALIEPCTVSGVAKKITTQGADEVDLLFMVDNSGSMKEEQANLARQLPNLAQILAKGELPLPDGTIRKFSPVRSLHIGVVTSDMGINGVTGIDGCSGVGNDGLLQVKPMGFQVDPATSMLTTMPCGAATTVEGGNHLNFDAGKTSAAALGVDFGCITQLGTGGCGFEQQLESIWKALAPSSDKSFTNGSGGHGDSENAGFLRPNSVVAVVAVTDEEDCSIPDSSRDIFAPTPTDPKFKPNGKAEGVNSRCAIHANDGTLHMVDRYVKGLRSIRAGNEDLVIFAAIAGIPQSAEGMMTGDGLQDFDGILAMNEMQIKFDKADPVALMSASGVLPDPACETANGKASPARRFVEVAKGFGTNGIVRSICRDDFSSALNSIIDKIANKLTGACLSRQLILSSDGVVECDIVEYLPAGMTSCNKAKGRVPAEKDPVRMVDGVARTVCKINQVSVDTACADAAKKAGGVEDPTSCLRPNKTDGRVTDQLTGWYYDYFTKELVETCTMAGAQQRIGFTADAEQESGSEVRFECFQPVFSVLENPRGKEAVNKPCASSGTTSIAKLATEKGDSCAKFADDEFQTLRCAPKSNTCQIVCSSDAQCPDSWVCERDQEAVGFCTNPICPANN